MYQSAKAEEYVLQCVHVCLYQYPAFGRDSNVYASEYMPGQLFVLQKVWSYAHCNVFGFGK